LVNDLFPRKNIVKTISINEEDKIKGDILFTEVIMNLLTNAVKNHSSDEINIEVIGEKKEGKYRLSIIDHGKGIPPQEREEVFTRFSEYRKTGKGSGLGLYIVKSLVENYKGQIWIESRIEEDYSQGTALIMEFPLE
jgi:signal transduction histidine kinase